MKKLAIILLSVLVAGLFVACNQEVTIDAQTYANMEVGTFVLNGQNYATLQAAIDALSSKAVGDNDGVIYLTRDFSGPGAVIEGKNVKIDFGANKYTFTNVTATQGSTSGTFGLKIKGGSSVTLAGTKSMDLFDSTTGLTMVYVEGEGTSLAVEQAPQMSVADDQFVFWAANGATLTIGGETKVSGSIAATGSTSTPKVIVTESAAIAVPEMKTENAAVLLNTSGDTTVTKISATDTEVVVTGTGSVNVASAGTSDGLTVQNLSDNTVIIGEKTVSKDNQRTIDNGEASGESAADKDAAKDIIDNLKKFESGTGTVADPYIIKTAAQLELFRDSVNFGETYAEKYIKLDSDITLTGVWTPIGTGYRNKPTIKGSKFSGTFDGNNKTITGLTDGDEYKPASDAYNIGDNKSYCYGLFGAVEDATIKNLKLADVAIKSSNTGYTADNVGAVVGYSYGSLVIENCTVSGSVSGENAAGIIGRAYVAKVSQDASIKGCTNNATITAKRVYTESTGNSYTARAAGIAAYVNGATASTFTGTSVTVSGCTNNGDLSSTSPLPILAGIVVYGFNDGVADEYNFTSNTNSGSLSIGGAEFASARVAMIACETNNGLDTSNDKYDFAGNISVSQVITVPGGSINNVILVSVTGGGIGSGKDTRTEYNNTTNSYDGGTGTLGDPYQIASEATLKFFRDQVNAGNSYSGEYFELKYDITLTEAWTPIGNSYRKQEYGAYFAGTFDGNKKTISGLTNDGITPVVEDENATHKEYVYGLFGVVKGATIKDLTLTNVSIVNPDTYEGTSVGAVIGYSDGTLSLTGCVVGAADKGDKSSIVGNTVGGIIGRAYGTAGNSQISITGCKNYASVTANVADDQAKTKAAGIVGYVTCTATSGVPTVTLEGNENYGYIESDCTQNSIISGIAIYGFQPDGQTASFTFKKNENHGELKVGTNGILAAFIASNCHKTIKTGDLLTATDNKNKGSISGGTTTCNLVVNGQNGAECNIDSST